jgi:hypothetical protein
MPALKPANLSPLEVFTTSMSDFDGVYECGSGCFSNYFLFGNVSK